MHFKKRSLFLLTFLLLLVYSCYDDLSLPSHGDRDSGEFSISEAHKYFEEHATDLSFIHITDSSRVHTRSVSRRAELSPDWDRAVRTVGKEAVLIEVPLNSNAVLLESVRYFMKGKITISKGGVSRMRLVMAQRTDGNVDMFVATLVPSPRYPNTQKDLESFRYLGGQGNFTGKVFCSTLDGHFVEAHQYIGGKFFSKVHAIPRAHLEKMGVDLSDVSYESIIFTPGVLSRSGTYDFDETDGSGSLMCESHPSYLAEYCPFCLDEVVVIACQRCGRRLEDGEICTCICSWCFQYPCRCCEWCHTYPCIHSNTLCQVCFTDPCTKCTYCGLHYCYGQCQNIGSGGGGGSTTPSNPTPDSDSNSEIKHDKHIIVDSDSLAREDLSNFSRKKQAGNTCVPVVLEYISKMIDADKYVKRREFLIFLQDLVNKKNKVKKHDVRTLGLPIWAIAAGIIEYFGDYMGGTAYGSNSLEIENIIDNGGVVMTNILISDNMWHNILVIGYTSNQEYIYIDPNDNENFYKCSREDLKMKSSLKYYFEIILPKLNKR